MFKKQESGEICLVKQAVKGPRTLQLKLQKSRYCPDTLQLFFTAAKILATVLYIGNDFCNNFLAYGWYRVLQNWSSVDKSKRKRLPVHLEVLRGRCCDFSVVCTL